MRPDFGTEPRPRRRWLRGLLWGLLGLIPLLAFLAFGVLWLTVPPDNQTLRIPGLSAPVDITFDGNGVPRIEAANEKDAATALGYVHARDRMFQMDLMRRAASGRLSELVGPADPADRQADAGARPRRVWPRAISPRNRPRRAACWRPTRPA